MIQMAQKIVLLCIVIFACFFNVKSQANIADIKLKNLSVNDGLSQGTINSVLQDSRGYIWLATESGINLYDGYTFKKLQGPDEGFDKLAAYDLLEDKNKDIWFVVGTKGLYRYNVEMNNYVQVIAENPLDMNDYIDNIILTDHNELVIAKDKILSQFNYSTQTFELLIDLTEHIGANSRISNVVIENKIAYVSSRRGVFLVDLTSKKIKKLPPFSFDLSDQKLVNEREAIKTFDLHLSESYQLYLGTNDGVISIDVKNVKGYINGKQSLSRYQLVVPNLGVYKFLQHQEKFYIASTTGLSSLNLITHQHTELVKFSVADDQVNDNTVTDFIVSNDGKFWLGSAARGVYVWQPQEKLVTNFSYQKNNSASLSYNEVWNILPHHKNPHKFWVATSNGLNLVDELSKTTQQFLVNNDKKENFSHSHIYQVIQLNEQHLLLVTAKGAVLFNTESLTLENNHYSAEINDVFKQNIFSVYQADKNHLWVVSEQSVLKINLVENIVKPINIITEKISVELMYSFLGFIPTTSKMLFSTINALWLYDENLETLNNIYTFPNAKNNAAAIDNVIFDNNGLMWLALSTEGLIALSTDTFEVKHTFTNKNSIIDANVYGAKIDNDGDIWVSTHDGIFLLNTQTMHLRRFDSTNGFINNEFNSAASAWLSEGRLAYGSMFGVSIFDPLKLKSQVLLKNNIQPHLSNISILSRALSLPPFLNSDEPIALNYEDVGIRLDFSEFSFSKKNRLQFQYTLAGTDNITYPLTYDNYITFPSLTSGSHRLEVKAKSPITGEFSQPTIVTLNVSYAPWASPWAYLAYWVLTFSSLTMFMVYRATKRKKLIAAHEQVKFRENRLQLALTGSNSEVWDWHAENNLMFGKRISNELGFDHIAEAYPFSEHLDLIHPHDRELFSSKWVAFIDAKNPEENFTCTYRLKNNQDGWLWYKDLGKIVKSFSNGAPRRITGSYTNITASRAAEERATYYGEAFKQTKDWVLIISENFTKVTANQSLRDIFGWENEEFDFSTNLLGLDQEREAKYKQTLSNLNEGEHWRSEECIKSKNGEEYHVIVNITASRNTASNSLYFVCVITDITAQKNAEHELRYLANYDHLTNLPNRTLLLDRVNHAIDQSKRKKTSVALFFVDLDRFKLVNDSLGHDYGDMLLKEITYRLTKALRVDDTVARLGGDEFVILLENYKSAAHLARIAQKVISVVEKPANLNENVVSVGASIGISIFPDDAKDPADLLRNADVAMYHAKKLGRNTFQFFTKRMNHEADSRLQMETNLQLALTNNEFINHYQPIIDAQSNKMIGVELLLRWQTKDGLVSPGAFIPIAEELGLIIPMTEQALLRGVADLKIWQELQPELYLSVNLSTFHFSRTSLIPLIKETLRDGQIKAADLKFEITENALISEPEKAINTMNALSDIGVKLALDDFGTGYSSLSYLKDLPLDVIKIDRTFVSGIGIDNANEAIIDVTLMLSQRLNVDCIAEGVETIEQLAYLQSRDCHHIQGFLFSKPIPNYEVIKLLELGSISSQ